MINFIHHENSHFNGISYTSFQLLIRFPKISWKIRILKFLLYKLFSFFLAGDEMFSDAYKMKLVDEVIYEVYAKLIQRSDGDIKIDGFNPSAEEADEGNDSNVESGVDVVLNHRLCETYAFNDKKSFTLYLKDYMKK